MASSTSSSDGLSGLAYWRALVGASVGPVFVALGLLGAATVAFALHRRPARATIDDVVVATQTARAPAVTAPLVVVGDSSGLMGVDAEALSAAVGRPVENLSLLAWAGPLAWSHQVEASSATGRAQDVVVVVNRASLALTNDVYAVAGTEALVESGVRPWPRRKVTAGRDWLFERVQDLVEYPLPGSYGRAYGFRDDLEAAQRAHHGSLVDPNQLKTAPVVPTCLPTPSADFLARAKQAAARFSGSRVWVVLSPVPEGRLKTSGCEVEASALRASLAAAFGGQALVTPLELPPGQFATETHLNRAGRETFTRAVAQALSAR